MGIRRLGIAVMALTALMVLPAGAPARQQATGFAGAYKPDARMSITNGHAPSRPYPFMAFVRRDEANRFGACGGTLIAARWVLTAGHCVVDSTGTVPPPAQFKVLLDKVDIRPQLANFNHPDWRAVARVMLHPTYTTAGAAINNDVALVQLAAPAPQAQARLPRPADAPLWAPGAPSTVIGFGKTSAAASTGSPDLLEAGMTMQPDNRCGITNGTVDVALNVCAASGGLPSACHGDSGGPLLVGGGENVLAGPVSLVPDTCIGGVNVFARVGSDPLNAWIRSIVPQSEIDVSPPAPQPGDSVTVTSAARGSYSTLTWDTDGNGSFGDAGGTVGFTRTLQTGQYRVGLQASNNAGDRETRYITVDVRPRTPINITEPRAPARVVEGQPVRITLAPGQAGSGTIAGQATPGSAKVKRDFDPSPFAAPLAFAAGESAKTLLIATRDDYTRERSESFRVSLGGPTGQLIVGNDAARDITIVDDDVVRLAGGRTIRVRGNRARVRLRTWRRGRVTVLLERRGSRRVTRLGTARPRLRRTGTVTVRVRLNRAGRRLLRRNRRTRAFVTLVRNRDPVGPPVRRTLRR